tara:strand:- start:31 stop:762 length:732 start_codon:yes stop_codon:yes gene_type:complete
MKKTKRGLYKKLGEGDKFLLTDYLSKGTKDYESYVENQKILNSKKFGVGCNDGIEVFEKIKEEVLNRNSEPTFGLCHGVRSGWENKTLGEQLNCKVIGTEIGDKFGHPEITIQWDMHEIKDEWIGKCDVIYTNSFDHSYDPIYALNQWSKCLKKTGIIVTQFTEEQPDIPSGGHHIQRAIDTKTYSPGDPFNAPFEIFKKMVDDYSPLKIVSINNWRGKFDDGEGMIIDYSHVKHIVLQLEDK